MQWYLPCLISCTDKCMLTSSDIIWPWARSKYSSTPREIQTTINWVVLQQYLFYEWSGMSYLNSSHINNMVSLKCSATFCNDQFDSWQYDRSNTEAQLNIYIIIYTYPRIHLLSLFRSGEFLHSSWLEHNVFRHICI